MDFNPNECVAIKSGDRIWYLRRWSFGVACWVSDSRGKTIRPQVFSVPIFDRFGRPVLGLDGGDPEQRRINFERMEQWLDEIPHNLKTRVFASFEDYQFLAIEAGQHNHEFADFVEQEHRRANVNFIIAAWALYRQLAQPSHYRREFNRRLTSERRSDLMRRLLDTKVPALFLKVLHRVARDSLDDESLLWNLLAGTRHKGFAQSLARVSKIAEPGFSITWRELPEWLYHPKILSCLCELQPGTRTLETLIPPAILNANGSERKRILQSLRTANNLEEFEDRLHSLSLALRLKAEFPRPPFKGTKLLFAVTTGKQLHSEGKYMHNCVAGYASSIAAGAHYFYHYAGAEQATVLLKRDLFDRWVVTEHLGIGNSQLSEETLVAIYRELAKFSSANGPLFFDTVRVAGLYYRKTPDLWRRLLQAHGSELRLKAEPENIHDPLAVAVYLRGEHLGYVPRSQNRTVSLIMHHGVRLKAVILQARGKFEEAELLIGIIPTPSTP